MSELIGENPFDQGFSICMAWLTVEVAITALNYAITGVIMLIAKTRKKSFRQELAEAMVADIPPEEITAFVEKLPLERLEAILEKKRNQVSANGASAPDGHAKPKA